MDGHSLPASPPRGMGTASSAHDEFLALFQEVGLEKLAQDVGMIQNGTIPQLREEPDGRRRKLPPHAASSMDLMSHAPRMGLIDFDDEDSRAKKRASLPLRTTMSPATFGGELSSPSSAPTDKASKGLRHFSMKVCRKVEEKGQTTYNEVADELVHEFLHGSTAPRPGEKPQFDEKNIRRRVYDALNVLMAMDIISKEKKEIRWKGLPSNAMHDKEALEKEKVRLQRSIQKKQEHLQQLMEQQVMYQNLVKQNAEVEAQDASRPPSHALEDGETRIALPFIVINTRQDTVIQCEMTESRNEVMFQFSAPFQISDDNEVLKRMGLQTADDSDLRRMFHPRVLSYLPESVKRQRVSL
mmetsp:Transcript_25793/g.75222  ORF Transcript_25793/g.75222 Transcript_25793/m.75222 type:complete len:355 (-) Transcript_25793:137-1201(-)